MSSDTRAMVFFEVTGLLTAIFVYLHAWPPAAFMGLQAIYWLTLAVKREPPQ